MSLNITLRPSGATWTEALTHRFDVMLERLDDLVRGFAKDLRSDFRRPAHETRVRRLVARGCSGQALS